MIFSCVFFYGKKYLLLSFFSVIELMIEADLAMNFLFPLLDDSGGRILTRFMQKHSEIKPFI